MNTLTDRVESVSFLKGIAILSIILVHYSQRPAFPSWLEFIFRFGQMGCQIFFVLSAFTLCLSLSKKEKSWLQFMKVRVYKIAPGYWIMILVYFCLGLASIRQFGYNYFGKGTNIFGVITNFLFLNGLIPAYNNNVVRGGWYIGTTVIFYLLTPTLFDIFRRRGFSKAKTIIFPLITTLIGIAVVILVSWIFPDYYPRNNSFMYFSFVNQMGCYSFGFCLFELYNSKSIYTVKKPLLKCVMFLISSIALFYMEFPYAFSVIPATVGASTLYLFTFFEQSNTKLDHCCICETVKKFGNISFVIFLTHVFVVRELMLAIEIIVSKFNYGIMPAWLYISLIPVICGLAFGLGKIFNSILDKIYAMLV